MEKRELVKKAYAKINLGLKTLKKREDGYHELEMVMVNIDLCDTLYFALSKDIKVLMDNDICKMEDNIVYKAAMLMKNTYSVEEGISIRIEKHIPDGGGLGGGSSDAACAILILNEIWNLNLNTKELNGIASKIGSDVSFFLYNKPSIVKGRGEIVLPLDQTVDEDIVLVMPKLKCSTKDIYMNHVIKDNNNTIENITINISTNYYGYLFNDLEDTTKKIYKEYKLDDIKKELIKCGCVASLMSGSGSTIFGIKDKNKEFDSKEFERKYSDCKIIYCKTISSCK